MAVTYTTAVKTARMNAVKDAIDGGSGAGKIEIGTTAMAATLATVTLADPCGSVSGAVLTFTMPQSDTSADGTGTAAAARIRNSDSTDVITGLTVGLAGSGANIIVDSTSLTAGQTFTINSATITHAQ